MVEEEKKKVLEIALKAIADKFGRKLSKLESAFKSSGRGVYLDEKGIGSVSFYERRGDQEIWYYLVRVDIKEESVRECFGQQKAYSKDYELPSKFDAQIIDIELKKDKHGKEALFMTLLVLPTGKINTQKYLPEHFRELLLPELERMGMRDTDDLDDMKGGIYEFTKIKPSSQYSKVRWIPTKIKTKRQRMELERKWEEVALEEIPIIEERPESVEFSDYDLIQYRCTEEEDPFKEELVWDDETGKFKKKSEKL